MKLIGYVVNLIAFIWLGVATWDWIEPKTFVQGIFWFIVWGVSSAIVSLLISMAVVMMERD